MAMPTTTLPAISSSGLVVDEQQVIGDFSDSPESENRPSSKGGSKTTARRSSKREHRGTSAAAGAHHAAKIRRGNRRPPTSGKRWTELGRAVGTEKSAGRRADSSAEVERQVTSMAEETADASSQSTCSATSAQKTESIASSVFYDTDFESDASTDVDVDGRLAYRLGCRALGVPVLPRVVAQWSGPAINVNYRNLGPRGVKALASALALNPNVKKVELRENRIGGIGAMYLCTYMRDNVFITHLNIAQNDLGSMGAMAIAELLERNRVLEYLDLSDNNLRDSDGEHLAKAIESAERLKYLNLSHNFLSEDGATRVGRAIGRNDSLEKIDISWNQLRRKGAVSICAGVKRNANITSVNLSWNGLGYEGSIGLGELLRENDSLRMLDITSNRINWEGAVLVARGLSRNTTLEKLKIGKNPLTMTGCQDILEALQANVNSKMKVLEMDDVPINQRIMQLIKSLQGIRPLDVSHGGVVESDDVIGRRMETKKDPIQMLLEFLTTRGIRPLDLFRQLKQDDNNMVTKEAFLQGLQNAKVPMQQNDIEAIIKRLDTMNGGKLSFNVLMKGVKDQIKVNREEERRRMDLEDRFNEERRRLMALTPPGDNDQKARESVTHTLQHELDWSDSEWMSEGEEEVDPISRSRRISLSQSIKSNIVGNKRKSPKATTSRRGSVVLPSIANTPLNLSHSKTRHDMSQLQLAGKRRKSKLLSMSGGSLLEMATELPNRYELEPRRSLDEAIRANQNRREEANARTRKPQRLIPLAGQPKVPTASDPGQALAGDTLGGGSSWMALGSPDSSVLPSARFSQPVLEARGLHYHRPGAIGENPDNINKPSDKDNK